MESVEKDPAAASSVAAAAAVPLSEGSKPAPIADPAYQISQEHCYSKLGPFRSTASAGFFPTEVLFPALADEDAGQSARDDATGEHGHHGVRNEDEEEGEEEGEVDVVSVAPPTSLPYDESKVGLIMMECVKHLNLVKIPPENSDLLLEKVLLECGFQQRRLLSTLLRILQGDHLARLTCQQAAHEPIKRRLHNDRAVRQFRKALSDVNWDPKLVTWAHETLIQLLDSDLLPVYLDVLQILKSKCPVLVEQVVHSSLNLVGGEAFSLLLKRPWNPVIGMSPVDRQVHFENPPLFVTLPYSSVGLGGRRWRLWQSQLSSIGKVYPVIVPEALSEPGSSRSLVEFSEAILILSLSRVKELHHQFPTRPLVLLAWTVAGRIAAKIAEVIPVSCIVCLGLPARGLNHKWEVSSDLFTQCNSPTIFIVGSRGTLSSVSYVERLRTRLSVPNALVVVGGADDLLRLSSQDKHREEVCQSIADRCMLEKIYRFLVYNLPSSFPDETHKTMATRKRKSSSHCDEISASFLTPAVSSSSIVLNPHPPPAGDDPSWNCNLNNSNAFLKSFLSMRHGSRGSFSSCSPSPVHFDARGDSERPPPIKIPLVSGDLPKIGRPRSKSTADRPKKKAMVHSRSQSIDPSPKTITVVPSTSPAGMEVCKLNTNNNNNNSNSASSSPTRLLQIPYTLFQPLPITPPRNPFEGSSAQKLNPKTLKQLQR